MSRAAVATACFLTATCFPHLARAVTSAEVYTSATYGYGRLEARVRFAAGDGVVSSFFLWKPGSEGAGTFWNELDFEKVGADCHVETNAIYGNPAANHSQAHPSDGACSAYHTYAYEWTPDVIAWFVDGVEVRRDTGATATAYAQNAASGMQIRFNVWPGDASFGGNFNPNILPVHQYVDWVQFSSYEGGTFTLDWREDFNGGALPSGWLTANWGSPKNLSTHDRRNVNLIDGYLVVSLTADNAVGPAGAMPVAPDGSGGQAGAGGTGGSAGTGGSGGTAGAGGRTDMAGAGGIAGAAGDGGSGATPGAGGSTAGSGGVGGAAGSGGIAGTAGSALGVAGSGGTAMSGGSGGGAGSLGTGGGTAGSVAHGGASGSTNQAGSVGKAGSGARDGTGEQPATGADGGCSVGASGAGSSSALLGVLGLCALACGQHLRTRFRRRQRAPHP